jgi:histidinol-phosphatase (PHP family)
MIRQLKPAVVAHFDLMRLYDRDHRKRLEVTEIRRRITRNLQQIAFRDLVLDFNVAALRKGAAEPYLSRQIL